MDRSSKFYEQVRLLLRILPLVGEEDCFALKGGTAINLFFREFPRLSVDIDLVYLRDGARNEALADISQALNRIAASIEKAFEPVDVIRDYLDKPDALRLLVRKDGVTVKVELSPVIRGTVYPTETRSVVPLVEEQLGYAEMQVVSVEDLYAGKLCAAFDRQHPRDFFDVLLLMGADGITDRIRKAFIVYLASHPRPMEEILSPRWASVDEKYEEEFQGMTDRAISAEELLAAAKDALRTILSTMIREEKRFLCSLYERDPDWSLLDIDGVEKLPALQWKLRNIRNMSAEKRERSLRTLKSILEFQNQP